MNNTTIDILNEEIKYTPTLGLLKAKQEYRRTKSILQAAISFEAALTKNPRDLDDETIIKKARSVIAKTDENGKKILNKVIERAQKNTPKVKKGRSSNETAIEAFMRAWKKHNGVSHINMDFKGTKLKKGAFSDLKRDELMTIPGIPPFKFEAKKGKISDLKGPKGILFGEANKLYTSSKKADLLADPEKLKKINKHNKKLEKEYSPEIMAQIKKDLGKKNENKPYLFIGGETPESIRVVYPYQYWIDTNIHKGYLPDRFQMIARGKPKMKESELLTLPEFFKRMMVEGEAEDFTKEIIND